MAISQMEGPSGEHVAFWRRFADEIGSGVPLLKALESAREAVAGTELDRAAVATEEAVRAGEDFSKALEAHEGVFPRAVRAMVRAGEAGGVLDVIAKRIAEGLEDGSFPLPGAESKIEPGDAATARTFRAFGRLISSGVPILEALGIVSKDACVPAMTEALAEVTRAVRDGGGMGDAMAEFPEVFAGPVVEAVRWGEAIRHLDTALLDAAAALEKGDLGSLPRLSPEDTAADVAGRIQKMGDAAPVVKLVNLMILEGIQSGATDIHIEPYEKEVKVRFRIDGICVERLSPPRKMHSAVVSRLKIMADMDIAERRMPQDGKIKINVRGTPYDLRVAVMPTVYGETVGMRILRPEGATRSLDEVVSVKADLERVRAACRLPEGAVLVTGASGTGKSTLLYSMVHEIDRTANCVVSVEDPVEYTMEGVQQVQVNYKLGQTIATMVGVALRHDPDVVVVGEVRDTETAARVFEAATTGHLMLAMLHAPTAVDAVTQLVDMGLEPFRVNGALAGVVSQRLVRKLCPTCRAEAKAPEEGTPKEAAEIIRGLGDATFFSPVGCGECNGGYKGRAAIQEVLIPDDGFRRALASGADRVALERAGREGGAVPFVRRGLELAAKGVTSAEEALRVTWGSRTHPA
ncbi:MAG: ATPase, T2SS/T4P/T4SS family [Planctomycetota bacterium]|jgi:type II secretory ATPase GspE/PulE/Tfp pilus assembly ATPase PilB-like protein